MSVLLIYFSRSYRHLCLLQLNQLSFQVNLISSNRVYNKRKIHGLPRGHRLHLAKIIMINQGFLLISHDVKYTFEYGASINIYK